MTKSQNFYINVKHICSERNISMTDIETAVDISSGYLSRGKLGLDKAYEIADFLGEKVDDLIQEENHKLRFCPYCGGFVQSSVSDNGYIILECSSCKRKTTISY